MSGRAVKHHASGDPFLRNAANEILKRHATFPRVRWQDAVAAISETLEAAARKVIEMSETLTTTHHPETVSEPLDTELVELAKRVFLAGHSEGWTGNQCRRDVQHIDAEKGWSLYVGNGALDKAIKASAIESLSTKLEEAREALRECADDLEAELQARWPVDAEGSRHPALQPKFERDMAPVRKARALLSEGDDGE